MNILSEPEMECLRALIYQVTHIPISAELVDCSSDEAKNFVREHPNADFVIGDFEIKCINREKYGLDPK